MQINQARGYLVLFIFRIFQTERETVDGYSYLLRGCLFGSEIETIQYGPYSRKSCFHLCGINNLLSKGANISCIPWEFSLIADEQFLNMPICNGVQTRNFQASLRREVFKLEKESKNNMKLECFCPLRCNRVTYTLQV